MTPGLITFVLDLFDMQKVIDQILDDLVTVWLLDDL